MKALLSGNWRNFACHLLGVLPDQVGDVWYDDESKQITVQTLGVMEFIKIEFTVKED